MSGPQSWAISGVDLHLDLATHRRRQAVETSLRDAIRDGRLSPGTRLPASRGLALDLGLARNTIAEAYAQLVAEGWLEARQGSGTRVANRASSPTRPGAAPSEPSSRRPRFDLTPGQPDVTSFPRTAWSAATRQVLLEADSTDLGYGDPLGATALRTSLSAYLARVRGVRTDPQHLIICAGFAQAIELLGVALVSRGTRRIAVESFCIAKHRAGLLRAGLEVVGLPVDRDGVDTSALIDLDPDAVLVTPAHQFPLGMALAPHRRDELVGWASRRTRWVIEDDYDGEFRFDRRPVGAVQALAPDRVIYAGTASKTLAPGLRLGWLAVPTELLAELSEHKRSAAAQNGIIDQLTLAKLIDSGQYDRHVRRSRLEYRRRRDRLVVALTREQAHPVISGIAAGLHALVWLPSGMSESEAVARGLDRGVELQGLLDYSTGVEDRDPALVVGFGTPAPHTFTGAIARLAATLRR